MDAAPNLSQTAKEDPADRSADLDTTNDDERTPLTELCGYGDHRSATVLLDAERENTKGHSTVKQWSETWSNGPSKSSESTVLVTPEPCFPEANCIDDGGATMCLEPLGTDSEPTSRVTAPSFLCSHGDVPPNSDLLSFRDSCFPILRRRTTMGACRRRTSLRWMPRWIVLSRFKTRSRWNSSRLLAQRGSAW